MALSDYYSGTEFSGHKAPTAEQTNPDNDPEIAASQERLRQFGTLTADQFSNGRVVGNAKGGGWVYTGQGPNSGDTPSSEPPYRWVEWDTPAGVVRGKQFMTGTADAAPPEKPDASMALESGEKFWWKPGQPTP